MLESVGLGKEKKSYPHTLSGGMAQRVSLARAFSYPAKCMLMDEPFKGLDVPLKKQMMTLFSSLYAASPKTTVFVTHDIDEALLLGDRIILLTNNGILGEFSVDTPRENRTLTDLASLKEELFDLL